MYSEMALFRVLEIANNKCLGKHEANIDSALYNNLIK